MTPRRQLLRFALGGVAVITLVAAASPISSDELLCEEAVQHLASCCQAPVDRGYDCTAGRGCEMDPPDLYGALAEHVRGASCSTLVSEGACTNPPRNSGALDLSTGPIDLAVPDFARPADLMSHDAADDDGGP